MKILWWLFTFFVAMLYYLRWPVIFISMIVLALNDMTWPRVVVAGILLWALITIVMYLVTILIGSQVYKKFVKPF